jgi:hypothetical protein
VVAWSIPLLNPAGLLDPASPQLLIVRDVQELLLCYSRRALLLRRQRVPRLRICIKARDSAVTLDTHLVLCQDGFELLLQQLVLLCVLSLLLLQDGRGRRRVAWELQTRMLGLPLSRLSLVVQLTDAFGPRAAVLLSEIVMLRIKGSGVLALVAWPHLLFIN